MNGVADTTIPSGRRSRPGRAARVGVLVALGMVTAACANDGPQSAAPATAVVASETVEADSAAAPSTAGHGEHAAADSVPASAGSTAPAAAPGEPVLIISRDNTFTPEVIEVPVGTEVIWKNAGRTEHDMYPVDDTLDWGVAPEDFPPGTTYSHVFTEPGEYPYYCTIHGTTTRGMVGTIIVTG